MLKNIKLSARPEVLNNVVVLVAASNIRAGRQILLILGKETLQVSKERSKQAKKMKTLRAKNYVRKPFPVCTSSMQS